MFTDVDSKIAWDLYIIYPILNIQHEINIQKNKKNKKKLSCLKKKESVLLESTHTLQNNKLYGEWSIQYAGINTYNTNVIIYRKKPRD